MEQIFQTLTVEKIQDMLVICGIGDCSDEPIQQYVLGISEIGEPPKKQTCSSKGQRATYFFESL